MKKKSKQERKGFDERFDAGEEIIDFSSGIVTRGLSHTIKFPPIEIPAWLAGEIDHLSKFQANSKASVVRQLLVEAIEARKRRMAS